MADRRIILAVTTVLALGLGVGSPATASTSAAAVEKEAAGILATATAGEPLTVVTTTQTADGPRFTTEEAGTRGEALDLIAEALDEPGVSVDVAHPMSIAASKPRRVNDTYRTQQWALNRLEAETVWRKSSGKGIVVAVLDTGVRANHPDLRGRVVKGWDFIGSDNVANDANGHGTHVAGIIAARRNNDRGIAGLASQATILPVRVLDGNGNGNTATVARGITYAVKKGADVINLSLAGQTGDRHVAAAVAYAVKKGVVVVAAAGNSGCGQARSYTPAYPAVYPGVIAVGATDRYDNVAPYSNCGSYVDVVAPGSSIVSTTVYAPHGGLGCGYGDNYCRLNGTSMATPYAAASAAVLMSRTRNRLGGAKIRAIMTGQAVDIGAPGRDSLAGYGLISPKRMMYGR
ncbi:MAG: S8 family serine peptidase [Aeromicrobium sp.]